MLKSLCISSGMKGCLIMRRKVDHEEPMFAKVVASIDGLNGEDWLSHQEAMDLFLSAASFMVRVLHHDGSTYTAYLPEFGTTHTAKGKLFVVKVPQEVEGEWKLNLFVRSIEVSMPAVAEEYAEFEIGDIRAIEILQAIIGPVIFEPNPVDRQVLVNKLELLNIMAVVGHLMLPNGQFVDFGNNGVSISRDSKPIEYYNYSTVSDLDAERNIQLGSINLAIWSIDLLFYPVAYVSETKTAEVS